MKIRAILILADGFEEVEAITPIDLLRRAGIEVTIAGLSRRTVSGSHDVCLETDALLNESSADDFDALILPGGQPGTTNLRESNEVVAFVNAMYESGRLCAAICAAPSVFSAAGILDKKRVTAYPGTQERLKGALFSEENVVIDGTIITSRGVGTAILFSLAIINYLKGKEAANKVADAILAAPLP